MTSFTLIPKHVEEELEKWTVTPSRRNFIKSAGMLVVGLATAGSGVLVPEAAAQSASAAGPYPDPDFRQLDSWIVIHQDNTATFYVGKTDCGQGTGTSFRQLMSDELDFAYDKNVVRHGKHRHYGGPKADPADRRPLSATPGRCGAWRRKPAGYCSRWDRRSSACR